MFKTFSIEIGGRTLSVDIGRVSAQANGAAFMHYGDTTVLSTATASEKPRDGIDFFPLSVEYEEKMYSVGKMPGGFNKRESRPSENSILTARVIDRPMRPLFPKDFRNDVTLNNLVLSVDPQCRPEIVAMIGTAMAASISDIPFDGPCAMTQVGMKNGELIINPGQEVWDSGDLRLTVASTSEKVIMIEAGANEIKDDVMLVKKSYEKRGYKVAQIKFDENMKFAWAIKKRPIMRVTDLTYENIRHISAAKLIEVLDRNFGGGWDSLSQSIQDIILSGFDISTTTLPKDRLHKKGGLYEKKIEDGYEVLEVAKGSWVASEPVPCFERCDLCGVRVLIIYQSCVRKRLLVHSRREPQELCELLLVLHQTVCYFRPVVKDGIVSAQFPTPISYISLKMY